MEALLLIIGAIVLMVLVIAGALVYGAFTWGLVVFKFWHWFVLPVFTTVPDINYVQAIGIMMFIGLFHGQNYQILKKEYKDTKTANIFPWIAPWISLGIGYLVKVFIVG